VQTFAKTTRTNFGKTAVSTLETCLFGKKRLTKKLETAKQKPVFYIAAADVKALHPSL